MFFIIIFELFSQKHYNNWYFGELAGITFNTVSGEPEVLLDGAMITNEGCTTISDSLGNLLFYTNGRNVWNRFHKIMLNGNNLFGHNSASQSSIIVPKPGANYEYYIFTVYADEFRSNSPGFNYSIVDLSLDNGNGAITKKNIHLLDTTSERLAAIGHQNGKDVWIVNQDITEKCFVSYLLTKDSLDINPVKSLCSLNFNNYQAGIMKFSPDGKKTAFTSWVENKVYLYDFDYSTGKMSNEIFFTIPFGQPYGIEFSHNNQFLYVTSDIADVHLGFLNQYLYQYDVSNSDPVKIKGSEIIIYESDNERPFWALQMGPNKKIYMVRNNEYLSVINQPNKPGWSCDFSLDEFFLHGYVSILGLPSEVQYYKPKTEIINSELTFCEGDSILLTTGNYADAEYEWTGPLGFVSFIRNPLIKNSKPEMSGTYNYKISRNEITIFEGTIPVTVYPKAKILFEDNSEVILCADSYNLKAVDDTSNIQITWSGINSVENIVTITQSGQYKVFVETQFGCKDSATINIILNQPLDIKIISNQGSFLCKGENIQLSVSEGFAEYLWSTGDTSRYIFVSKGGMYFLHVKSETGCDGVDSILIQEFEKPEISFEKSSFTICKGDSVVLSPIVIKPDYEYFWSDGLKSSERVVKDNADLFLIAKTINGCQDSAFVKVEVLDVPNAKILANNTEACFGENITLNADNFNSDYEYIWSTGEKSDSIIINKSGKYSLKVNNKNLCFDSTSVDILIYPDLNLELASDKTILCFDDTTIISAKGKYEKYLWSTGETTEKIKVNDSGVFELIVQNKIGCADTSQIEIFKYYPVLTSDSENLNFNELCLGSTESKIIIFTLKSDFDFTLSKIYLKSNKFILNNVSSFLKTYKNNDFFKIPITFNTPIAGEFYDTLVIESNEPCYYQKAIPLSGTSKALFQFSLPNIITEAGSYLMIPINAGITCTNSDMLYSDYEIEISFDKEYFLPDSVKYGEIIEDNIVNQNRIIKIKSVAEFNKKLDSLLPINFLYGLALVGSKDIIPLTIDDVNFINKRYYPEFLKGSLKIEGCVNNLRPIQLFKPTQLSIAPNPSDGDIKIIVGTQEQGLFKIEIFNIQGQSIFTQEFSKSIAGFEEFDYFLNTQLMGSGVYEVHLASPWHLIRKQLLIAK
jgi:hypothetical protein